MSYFVVIRDAGPGWTEGKGAFEQPGVADHAAFMNALADEGIVLFAGPLAGSEHGRIRALVIINADSEAAIRDRLAADPWAQTHRLVINQRRAVEHLRRRRPARRRTHGVEEGFRSRLPRPALTNGQPEARRFNLSPPVRLGRRTTSHAMPTEIQTTVAAGFGGCGRRRVVASPRRVHPVLDRDHSPEALLGLASARHWLGDLTTMMASLERAYAVEGAGEIRCLPPARPSASSNGTTRRHEHRSPALPSAMEGQDWIDQYLTARNLPEPATHRLIRRPVHGWRLAVCPVQTPNGGEASAT